MVRFALAFLALLSGCSFEAEAPAGAQVLCADDNACPPAHSCDLARHVCMARGGAPPTILDVRFEPATLAEGAARLFIDADEPLVDAAVELSPESLPLHLISDPSSGAGFAFSLVVDDDVAEGTYVVTTVDAADREGNRTRFNPARTILVVDRTPPVLHSLVIEDATPGDGTSRFADVAPDDLVVATFFASEPILEESLSLNVGAFTAATEACALDPAGSLFFRCSTRLPRGAVAHGENAVVVRALDAAGNAGEATQAVAVDAAAPVLVAAAVGLDIRDAAGVRADTAQPGGAVTLTLVFDEPVEAPTAVVDVPGQQILFEGTGGGARWEMSFTIPPGVPDGAYAVRASFADLYGHTASDVLVPLPVPHEAGLTFSLVAPPCVIPGLDCSDSDGDGALAGVACLAASDCDDRDPLVYEGAVELPGDGRDNACAGTGDMPIDEAAGVFVDPVDGQDTGDGTRSAPFKSFLLAEAMALDEQKPFVFIATGTVNVGATIRASILGGLDPVTWQRGTDPTVAKVSGVCEAIRVRAPALDTLEHCGAVFSEVPATLVRLRATEISALAPTHGVDVNASFLLSVREPSRFTTSSADVATVDSGVLFHRSFFHQIRIGTRGILTATSTVVENVSGPAALDCADCAGAALFHSVAVSRGAPVLRASQAASLLVADSVLMQLDPVPVIAITAASSPPSVVRSTLFTPGESLATVDGVSLDASAVLASDALDVSELLLEAPGFELGTPGHISALSPLVGRGSVQDIIDYAAPLSVAVDIDGDCRYGDGAPDVGADEL